MSVFHDLASLNGHIVQPVTLMGVHLKQFFVAVKLFISTFGTLVILLGALTAIYRYIAGRCNPLKLNVNNIRLDLARNIILGLEFFIASDVIETTIAPDFQSLGILGILVVVRTILNFSLHKEIKELSSIPGSGISAAG